MSGHVVTDEMAKLLRAAGWVRPVRYRECEWLGQVLSDDEAVCEFFDTTTRWNDYCSHGEVRRA